MVFRPRNESVFCRARSLIAKLDPKIHGHDPGRPEPPCPCTHSGTRHTRKVTAFSTARYRFPASVIGFRYLRLPFWPHLASTYKQIDIFGQPGSLDEQFLNRIRRFPALPLVFDSHLAIGS